MELIDCTPRQIPKISCIYKITNILNSKVYIGQTVNLYGGYANHKSAKSNTIIHCAIRKYGFNNFKLQIIEVLPRDQDVLTEREMYWIDFYGSLDRSKGYNLELIPRTRKGHIVLDSTKQKLRVINAKRMADPSNNPMLGKRHTLQSIEQMKRTRLERQSGYRSVSKRVQKINPISRQVLLIYNSATEAAEVERVRISAISKAATTGMKVRGYEWKYIK